MAEPASTSVAAFVASLGGVTMAVLGVGYYALLYAFIGAVFGLIYGESMGMRIAVVKVALNTIMGALIGSALITFFVPDHAASIQVIALACLVSAAGANLIVSSLINAAVAKISAFGGEKQQ